MKHLNFKLLLLAMLFSFNLWAGTPQRIISLMPAVTKNIYQLDATDQLVGCTSFCTLHNPNDAEVVASAVKVNLEKALLLKPDLVVVSSLIPRETVDMFRKMGIEVLDFSFPKSFDDICQQMLTLGEKIGKPQKAQQLIADAQKRLALAQTLIPQQANRPTAFMQIGANPLFGVVPNTFMNDFLTFAHCENVAKDMKSGAVSREAILLSNPDYLFMVFMGSMGKDVGEKWKQYHSLKAVQQKHIYELDANLACSPTPDDFVTILEQIINHIYRAQ